MDPIKTTLSGWGNFPKASCYVLPIRSESDAATLVKRKNIPRGLGRSYADQAVNEGGVVGLCTKRNRMLHFDADSGVLECEAGTSLEEIITVFAPRGWFPLICPGTKFVTIGGAIANDIHGKAHHSDGSFVNAVLSFRIMIADGSILTASRTEHPDLFWANFGGMGLLGIILSAKLQLRKIETTYFVQKSIVIKHLDQLLRDLEANDPFYHYSLAWFDPLAKGARIGSGVLTLGNAARLQDLPPKYQPDPLKLHPSRKINLPFYIPDFTLNGLTSRILNKIIGRVQNKPEGLVHYEGFFFPLDAISNWNRGYGKRGFIQYQFVVPREGGKAHLLDIMEAIAGSGCTPFLNVFKTMGKGQGLLSFPFEGYTLAIDFPVSQKLKGFIPQLDRKVLQAGGRIYLGKDAFLDRETFYAMYPQVKDWLKIKATYDPADVFTSNLSRRVGLHNS